jgi:hypothetical protein
MKPKRNLFLDYINANTHGEWLAMSENERGFISKHKVHKSKKSYIRKPKHKDCHEN